MTDLDAAVDLAKEFHGKCDDLVCRAFVIHVVPRSVCKYARALLATVERAENLEREVERLNRLLHSQVCVVSVGNCEKLDALLEKAEGALKAFTDDSFTGESPVQKLYRLREIARAALTEIEATK
jgi:hypothetical protein